VVIDAARLGLDIGAAGVLDRYQRWRRADALALISVTDSLNRLFATDAAPVLLVRDLGLGWSTRSSAEARVRERCPRHAGKLPRLTADCRSSSGLQR